MDNIWNCYSSSSSSKLSSPEERDKIVDCKLNSMSDPPPNHITSHFVSYEQFITNIFHSTSKSISTTSTSTSNSISNNTTISNKNNPNNLRNNINYNHYYNYDLYNHNDNQHNNILNDLQDLYKRPSHTNKSRGLLFYMGDTQAHDFDQDYIGNQYMTYTVLYIYYV